MFPAQSPPALEFHRLVGSCSQGEAMTTVQAAVVNLNKRPYYIHWGVIRLSAGNLIVIVLMLVVFAAAVLVPFPKGGRS
jgi:hypothetical protein